VHHLPSKSSPAAASVDGGRPAARPLWVDGQHLECDGATLVADLSASIMITLSGELQFPSLRAV
jgi:hypothetical protein